MRYSLEQPKAYLEANVDGTFHAMEAARRHSVDHLLMASTSSVYGGSEEMPFAETAKADMRLTMYAATKKAIEAMGHAYAHLWGVPTTMFRFFTVYGPWTPRHGYIQVRRCDLDGRPIDLYNGGDLYRDFTYVGDSVEGIRLLIDAVPVRPGSAEKIEPSDSLSHVALFRVVNIGNSDKARLLDFVSAIEAATGLKAERNMMPMQKGDVVATWANADLLFRLTGYHPRTDVRKGVAKFVDWYRNYYDK